MGVDGIEQVKSYLQSLLYSMSEIQRLDLDRIKDVDKYLLRDLKRIDDELIELASYLTDITSD